MNWGDIREDLQGMSFDRGRRGQRGGKDKRDGFGGDDFGGGSSYGGGGGYSRGPREMHDAVCAQCGKDTQVPFRPSGDRPVYCSDCFSKQPSSSRQRY